ncbi:MAG: cell division protein FtsA [Bdellovibrionales bacterium GWB1_52_6]|nr:MAG: cell division protein FtsA [Bdellovibrionales bacterium GWB1_52_6]OFZ03489.1 MAG: cell division protein FtsA [Bdellovibrionales bacterium GWA1_52_35]HCM41073.1 cell division protein FtsA [Bdellovibrionales bacterium]
MSKKDFIVGLDIGTTKICCIVGEVAEGGPQPIIDIVGIGTAPSTGLRKGVVINIDSTVESISKAVEEAELMAGVEISTVYTGIAGGHIKSFNSTGIVAVKDKEITENDVQRVIDAAKAVAIPLDREVIHIIPQEYMINGQDGIRDPIGMTGLRLESKVHIVTGAVSSAQNIIKCANKAGLNVAEICLEPIASSEAVLSQDEKELGVLLVDIGGGTSDIAIFKDGAIVHTGVLAIGGNHITNDIAVGLRTPQNEAEKIKIRYGCAMASMISPEDTIEVPGVGGRKPRVVSRRVVAEIIEPRVEEIFSLIQREVMKAGFQEGLAGGVVITGGAALLEGMPELGEFIFEMPVKRGFPLNIGGLRDVVNSPKFATGVGLLKYGARNLQRSKFPIRDKNIYDKVRGSMKGWIKDLF